MIDCSYIIQKVVLTAWLAGSLSPVYGQSFRLQEIRDLEQMRNNYGHAIADYDLDGKLDVFIVAFDSFDPNIPETWSRLLKNYGNGRFENVTREAGFSRQYQNQGIQDNKLGASWGDYNNDGYPDLVLTHMGRTELFQNLGNGRFKEVSLLSNIASACGDCVNNSALWWDYNKDGFLDLYISDGRMANRLYRNLGDGRFEDVSDSTGLGDKGATWSSLPLDANQDGWLDLLVLNDYGQSAFYESIQGQFFEEKTQAYGLENPGDAMGATIGDCDGDGYFDLYITNISDFVPNPLFMGTDMETYENRAAANRVEVGHWAWGTQFFDADHDGDEDLYIANGWPGFESDNKFYKNLHIEGQSGFVDWSIPSATNGSAHGMSTEVFDYDNDGDLDILVSNTNNSPSLYENIGTNGRNWLQVELEGKVSNRNGFGAVVRVWVGDRVLQRFHHGSGIMTQSVKPVHFGLGTSSLIDSLAVNWPSGLREVYYDIGSDQNIHLIEGEGKEREEPLLTHLGNSLDEEKHPIYFYPNPFSQSVHLDLEKRTSGRLKWEVHTPQGQFLFGHTILKNTHQQLVLDLSHLKLASGIYVFTLELEGRRYSRRLVKF